MSNVGKLFPSISVKSINYTGEVTKINLLELAKKNNKKIVLFWYPKDFTFVCPTELHSFQESLADFEKKNTIVIGASCDTAEVHYAWLNTPKKSGGIEGVKYALISDSNRNLSNELDILNAEYLDEDSGMLLDEDNVTYRATYLIDEDGKIFHESINDMPIGRNVNEYLRLIDAYTFVQKNGEVCPANWQEGKATMKADRDGILSYMNNN